MRSMPRELSKEEYFTAVDKPKRRFQMLALGRSRTVHLRKALAAPCYWFERDEVYEEDGKYWRRPDLGTIGLIVDGKTSVLFYLANSRVDTCTFAFDLTPTQLAKAVSAMKRAKLTSLIPAAALYAVENLPQPRRAVLEPALRKLVSSHRQGKTPRK